MINTRYPKWVILFAVLAMGFVACEDDDEDDNGMGGGNTDTNAGPTIAGQSFSIIENSANGTVIGTVQANDADNDPLTYRITDGNTDEAFALDEGEGVLTVNNLGVLDFETNPSFELTVMVKDSLDSASATITVNLEDVAAEPFINREQILAGLTDAYAQFRQYVELAYVFDAVYSDAVDAPDASWNAVGNRSVDLSDVKVEQLWDDAYSTIFILNNVIGAGDTLLTGEEQNEVIAQALALRSYLYYTLSSWFNAIPIESGLAPSDAPQEQLSAMRQFILADIATARQSLPISWPEGQTGNITQDAAAMIAARIHLAQMEWSEAISILNEIINRDIYTLSMDTADVGPDSPEMIWGFAKTGESVFDNLFTKADFVPFARLTEAYLGLAHASFEFGNSNDAVDNLNRIIERARGTAVPPSISPENFYSVLLSQYQVDLELEGEAFFVAQRLSDIAATLSIEEFRLLLPIPISVLEANVNLAQNPNY